MGGGYLIQTKRIIFLENEVQGQFKRKSRIVGKTLVSKYWLGTWGIILKQENSFGTHL